MANSRAVLQPVGGNGTSFGLKEKRAGGGGLCSNHGNINSNNGNYQQPTRLGGVAAVKATFHDVDNVNINDENAGFSETKRSRSAVPVEVFKTFFVYVDQSEEQHVAATFESVDNATTTSTIARNTTSMVDKKNCFVEKQQRLQVIDKSNTFQKDFNIHNDDYVLGITPMSVADIVPPIFVDRSHISNSVSELLNESKKSRSDGDHKPLPRNDRERFFEVAEYQEDILEYFRESEIKRRPKPHYMRHQVDINYSMRTILVNWLVEVSEEYNLDTETLYLSVSYTDRFLSHMSVVRNKLQLFGATAMYIASKYEEIYLSEVGDFVFITDDTYNKANVLRMEQIMLQTLAFDLCTPTAYVFINTYAVLADIPDKLKFLTQYISELSLLEANPYLRFVPSLISAASLALARHTLDYQIWTLLLEKITTYRLEDLKEVFLYLSKTHNAAATTAPQAIQEKYKLHKYRQVSTIKSIKIDKAIFDDLFREYNESRAAENKTEAASSCAASMTTSN